MFSVPLPVTNSAAAHKTQTTKAKAVVTNPSSPSLKTQTTIMANSNTEYKQKMEQNKKNNNNNNNNNSDVAITTANKMKNGNIKSSDIKAQQQQQRTTKEMPSSTVSLASASSKNMISSQCDSSSSSSSSTSSSSASSCSNSDNNNINIKNECNQSLEAVIKTELESADQNNDNSHDLTEADANDLQLSSKRQRPILLSSVNSHIVCSLCFGYLIDATTIVECLHSFCHSCLIKHLRTEQYCPRCEMMINTAKPNIKPDTTLQAIVYKLVPGLYERELVRKRAFYKDRPNEAALATPEQRGDDTEHLIFSPSDYMSISLEYADIDELMKSNAEYTELLKPRYLQCPAMCTVAHLKKLVYGKFEINSNRFTIDIMYKVKTIVLLDHYTLMDVAYIYTWKRDAPMRFYFRVKQSLKPIIRVKKNLIPEPKKEVTPPPLVEDAKLHSQAMCIVHEPTPSIVTVQADTSKMLEPEEIKQESEAEVSSTTEIQTPTPVEPKHFEIVQPQSPSTNSHETSLTDKLKITLVNKAVKDKSSHNDFNTPTRVRLIKEKKDNHKTSPSTSTPKDERKVENIKLKIDLSKQNSVTIINMSDPERKEIVKPVKPEKEWKVKTKKDKDSSPKSSPKSSPHSERKSKTPSPLTVPPLTIKAERISPLAKSNTSPSFETAEEDKKSQFLKSFALAPIKSIKAEKLESKSYKNPLKEFTHIIVNKNLSKDISLTSSSKRKNKEPVKALVVKKPKLSPPLATEDFKIKLPPIANSNPISPPTNTITNQKPLMPPPAPLTAMKPPSALPKKLQKPQHSKVSVAPPGSLTPHPMHGNNDNIQLAAPGSRTPIAKRFQPILPKAYRVNPFANIPSDVNKILKDAGTEIKSIPNEPITSKVYGPKTESAPLMGPPAMPTTNKAQSSQSTTSNSRNNTSAPPSKTAVSSKNKSYLNLALFNASKSKGNEVPPGCRTPMYTPNSPIYSPSSPQYVPNYNIPTMPTYKYTPKPNNSSNSYLQNVLGSSSPMAGLFPSPPVKKDTNTANNANNSATNHNTTPMNATTNRTELQAPKRVYPFARSPSPVEDPPEKQLKVKSLLNSCNINIPSSLSITITREDVESSCNGQQYPKHKSPVNNYIEILKLPDQPAENTENKRLSPPMQPSANNSLFPNPPVKRVTTPPLNPGKQLNNHKTGTGSTTQNGTNLKVNSQNMVANLNTMAKNNKGLIKSVAGNNTNKPQATNKSPTTTGDKKMASPEKRMTTSTSEQKSPNGDNSASKKFRHILPRQNSNPLPEVNIPKTHNSGNVIGTYSSPNGMNVKIHSNKNVQPSKKSPGAQQAQSSNKQHQLQTSAAQPQNGIKQTKSPQTTNVNSKTNQTQAFKLNNPSNKLSSPTATPPTPALPPALTHPMQAMLSPHLGLAATAACQNAAGQAELSKLLKENLLRAQVQAAVANQSNMFYPYAANAATAAQLGQFNPTMYNYQQAYIMDQLSRMQRAGNEAFSEYMQKLTTSMETNKPPADLTQPTKPAQNTKNLSSPKSSSASNNPNTSASPSTTTTKHPPTNEQQSTKTK